MKILLIVIGSLAGVFILFQIYTAFSTNKTHQQPYKVIRVEKDFEIRFYPAVTMATITSSAKSYKDLSNPGFSKLAVYIFGGNAAQKQIAMTSPVHMDINDTASSMSFVMPSEYTTENLPKPNNADVQLQTTTDEYVAATEFGGFASDKEIKRYAEKLENALKANGIAYHGNFRFLGYNPPFQLFGRKNEIIVSLNSGVK
jgi:hypothetical protein